MGIRNNVKTKDMSPARVGEKTKKSSSLPPDTVEYLKKWMMSPEHIAHPYPTEKEKAQIMADTGIELKQLTNWFVNNRKRYWKPRVEARLQQQAHAQNAVTAVAAAVVAASQRCHGLPDIGLFRPAVENNMFQTDGRQNINQPLSILNPSHPMPNFLSHNFLQQHIQAANTLNVVGSTANQKFNSQNKKEEMIDVLSFIDTNKALLSQHNPNESTEQNNPQVVSMGSVSSLASDSDSYSGLNDETCMPSFSSPMSAQPEQFVTFTKEQLNENVSKNESSMRTDNLRQELTLPELKNTGAVTRHEKINVNILLNDRNKFPSIEDVSILLNEDPNRILKSYLDYEISYSFPEDVYDDETKVRKFRDAEIAKVKNHLLQLYLSSESFNVSPDTRNNEKKDLGLDKDKPKIKRTRSYSDFAVGGASRIVKNTRPRSLTFEKASKATINNEESSFKKRRLFSKYKQEETEQWQNACLNAKSSLPSLEEAACLFGYNRRTPSYQ